jgi:hypothetical protein
MPQTRQIDIVLYVPLIMQPDRLSHACEYESRRPTRPLTVTPSSPSNSGSESDSDQIRRNLDLIDQCIEATSSDKRSPELIVREYDEDIHPWFPLLSDSTKARLRTSEARPPGLRLLGHALELIVTGPIHMSGDRAVVSPLYQAMKRTIATFEALDINTILVVQARIFTTLFEIVHGLFQPAYVSIASSTRAIEALDLFAGLEPNLDVALGASIDEEIILVRCGVAILGR